jgi:CDP-glucose 4,6-dehydratase
MKDFLIYKYKKILLSGHTGFKGSWLAIWLHSLGAEVVGLALDPYTERDNFVLSGIGNKIKADIRGDIRDKQILHQIFEKYQPEIVFHLAAQPLVRLSYQQPVETYEVNVMGTVNVLEEIRQCAATKVGVMITTDKCYENKEQLWGYRENEPMGGYDPYSSSKGAAEIAIASWRRSFMNPNNYEQHGKAIASARAGNVIGGGDWAIDRIIPDCIRALENGEPIQIRSPHSIRPWQHVLEPVSAYLKLGAVLWQNPQNYAEAWNFGPEIDSIVPVWDIAKMLIKNYNAQLPASQLIDASNSNAFHEAQLLVLDISKARYKLNWKPKWKLETAIVQTVDWYKNYTKQDIYSLCINQIEEYTQKKS